VAPANHDFNDSLPRLFMNPGERIIGHRSARQEKVTINFLNALQPKFFFVLPSFLGICLAGLLTKCLKCNCGCLQLDVGTWAFRKEIPERLIQAVSTISFNVLAKRRG